MGSLTNFYFLAPLFAYLTAQIIKFARKGFFGDSDLRYFFISGGMPSGHTSAVTALTVTTAILSGISSPLFGAVVVFSVVVIYDSLGVRRSSGQQSQAINTLADRLSSDLNDEYLAKIHLRKVLGHKPPEVAGGLVLGTVMALAFTYQTWIQEVQFLFQLPGPQERMAYLVIAAVLTVGSLVAWVFYTRKKYRKLATAQRLKTVLFWSLLAGGMLNSLFVLAEYQTLSLLEARLWPLLTYVLLALFHLGAWYKFYRFTPERLTEERKERRKVEKQRKRRRKNK